MKKTDYPASFWQDRIVQYAKNDWAHQLSPFGHTYIGHFSLPSDILELGTGAGQDALGMARLGHRVTATDGVATQFHDIEQQASADSISVSCQIVNLMNRFPFNDETFDGVYAQLVIHYFDDDQTQAIMNEIFRVLRPGGLIGILLNTVDDPEYASLPKYKQHPDMRLDRQIIKRYFSVESLTPFVKAFEPVVSDNKGRTPKDDTEGVGTLVRFIGRKPAASQS